MHTSIRDTVYVVHLQLCWLTQEVTYSHYSNMVEGYVAECISKKREVASQILTGQKSSEERRNRNISIACTSCSEPNNLFAKKTQALDEPEVHSKDRLDMESVIIRSTTITRIL
ncbi:hypothetical protein NQ315_013888 [Exocentrus adspersus]|uniref:Uncharacterized protein n=1 Tax=Exocentrus adspersus TaxID=1586481 RepID=A0AAV8V5W1_9CUCU|nr:hypothetical protein NQ315_013888 [Exocentrus adspersus]